MLGRDNLREATMQSGGRRPGTLRIWIALGGMIAMLALSVPATGLARGTPDPNLPNDPVTSNGSGVMGVSSRDVARPRVVPLAAVCPSGTPLQGVDVSHYDGTINWNQVEQSGRSFAYAKATEGTAYVDPTFSTNYRGIKAAGMKAGAYHFFHPADDPTAQAILLVTTLESANVAVGDLAPVLDVEVTDGQSPATIAANLQTMIAVVRQRLGVTPIIYTSASYWNANVATTSFSSDPLWTAYWSATCPSVPNGWNAWVFWQYSAQGNVTGISSTVDLDESFGASLPVLPTVPTRVVLPTLFNSAP